MALNSKWWRQKWIDLGRAAGPENSRNVEGLAHSTMVSSHVDIFVTRQGS